MDSFRRSVYHGLPNKYNLTSFLSEELRLKMSKVALSEMRLNRCPDCALCFGLKNFLGYSFFRSGFTADYELPGKKFKMFVIDGGDPAECRGVMEKYLVQIKSQAKPVEGPIRVKDPYHGEADLLWKGKFILGVLDLDDPALRSRYLQEMETRLQK